MVGLFFLVLKDLNNRSSISDASEAENAAGQNDVVVTVNIATELPTGLKSISLLSPNFFYITIFFPIFNVGFHHI